MPSCDALALFTTPIHSSIKGFISAIDGSYERCGQSDQLRSRAKSHRLFQLLAKEMGAQLVGFLFYTKVRWLSRDKCFYRLYELKNEVEIFLRESKNNLHDQFHNKEFVVMLAYLADVFGHLNDIIFARPRCGTDVKDKLAGLIARIGVWQPRIKVGPINSFLLLEKRLKVNRIDLPDNIQI